MMTDVTKLMTTAGMNYLQWPCRGFHRAGREPLVSALLRQTFRWSGRVSSAPCRWSPWKWKT